MLLFLLPFAPAYAEECRWVEARGEVAIEEMTPREAQAIALRRARISAIETALGAEVRGKVLIRNYDLLGSFAESLTKGYVKEEKIVQWDHQSYQTSAEAPPTPLLSVRLKACVEPARSPQDKGFMITATLNKPVFFEGETATLQITASRRAYLHLFNLSADDRITLYNQPPMITMPMLVEEAATFTFPPKGAVLHMTVPQGFKKATEAFIVIATLDRLSLAPLFQNKTELSLPEFYSGLLSAQVDLIEEIIPYSVERR